VDECKPLLNGGESATPAKLVLEAGDALRINTRINIEA